MLLNKNRFCNGIHAIRNDEKLTLQQLSERSGINPAMISRIENGAFPATLTTILKLQNGLDISDERMRTLLGFTSKEYKEVPVIPERVKNFGEAIVKAKTLALVSDYTPKHSFIVKVGKGMSASINNVHFILINRDFKYINGKIYAVKLGDRILVGKVYKSKGGNYGILVTKKNSYFNVDYKGRYQVLGQAERIINMLEPFKL